MHVCTHMHMNTHAISESFMHHMPVSIFSIHKTYGTKGKAVFGEYQLSPTVISHEAASKNWKNVPFVYRSLQLQSSKLAGARKPVAPIFELK